MKDERFISKITQTFIDSKLTPLIIVAAFFLGFLAIFYTPREEEPQIVVPMIDVFVNMPGSCPKEVEQRVTYPMEKFLWEIPGVEYIYSTSMPGFSMAVVRFFVGEDEEKSIVNFFNKLYSNLDLIPYGASIPLIKPKYIDDVPILLLTLWSDKHTCYNLRRIAKQLEEEIKRVTNVSETHVFGGQRRQIRVTLNSSRMKAYHIPISRIVSILKGANKSLEIGSFSRNNKEFIIEVGDFIKSAEDLENIIVGVWKDLPVYLKDVAQIIDGPEEPDSYLFFKAGPQAKTKGITAKKDKFYRAVTISIAKRKGENATTIAETALKKVNSLKGSLIPSDVQVTVTRNYGETAKEKANELL
ncbi:MAG: efflux RND transporter permease subunit, partial [Thermodesulfobacteriota bacterium]|nr:efflux RND transporter permease subunit [Thermodesulfobacteriota bacterium]